MRYTKKKIEKKELIKIKKNNLYLFLDFSKLYIKYNNIRLVLDYCNIVSLKKYFKEVGII